MKIGIDGFPDHPKADPNCRICGGGGLLDDGNNYGCILVSCLCTGEATKETKEMVSRWIEVKKTK
jgi:hypothetical protein